MVAATDPNYERKLLDKLGLLITDVQIGALQDRRDKILSKLCMRKLQELALGGVGGGSSPLDTSGGASPRERKGPSSRGRQLLYWESLKSKTQEQGSMSWRGADEFAHEQPSSAR